MIQIYGITGKKGTGKDSLAKLVKEYDADFQIIRFADDLKWMSHKIFNFPLEFMESQEEKARKLETPIQMDDYLSEMIRYTGLSLRERAITAYSLREILQYFGSEYVRETKDSYWIDQVLQKIADLGNKILVTDVRFPNESVALRSIGGKIIRINRVDLPENKDSHQSELLMDSIAPDIILNTTTGSFDEQRNLAQKIANEGLLE